MDRWEWLQVDEGRKPVLLPDETILHSFEGTHLTDGDKSTSFQGGLLGICSMD